MQAISSLFRFTLPSDCVFSLRSVQSRFYDVICYIKYGIFLLYFMHIVSHFTDGGGLCVGLFPGGDLSSSPDCTWQSV